VIEKLTSGNCTECEILSGLFKVKRNSLQARITVGLGGFSDPYYNFRLMFSKLKGELMNKLNQIHDYLTANGSRLRVSHVVVFLAGTGRWEFEWEDFWDRLKEFQNGHTWQEDKLLYHEGKKLVGMPFRLIVQPNPTPNHLEYSDFPWR